MGKRINNPTLQPTDFSSSRLNDGKVLVDWSNLPQAKTLLVSLLGNSYIQGSITGNVGTWEDTLSSSHKFLKVSTNGGTNYIILPVVESSGAGTGVLTDDGVYKLLEGDAYITITHDDPNDKIIFTFNPDQLVINTSEGIGGGGDLSTALDLKLNYTGLDTLATPDHSADFVAIYDASEGVHKKALLEDVGNIYTAANLGSGSDGEGLFSATVGDEHRFKRVKGGTNVTVTSDTNNIVISSTDTGEANTASNLGTGSDGEGWYSGKVGADLQFKRLKPGTNITLTPTANSIQVDFSGDGVGENNTASNVGTAGVGIFKDKSGIDLRFKKLNAGSNKIIITDDTGNDEVDVDVAPANITHDSLGSVSANKHVDHTTVSLVNGTGISATGLGDLTASRTINLDISGLSADTEIVTTDNILIYDGSAHKKATVSLLPFVPPARTITPSEGIQGGGDLSTNRTLKLDINGLGVAADVQAGADYIVIYDTTAAAHKKTLISSLPTVSTTWGTITGTLSNQTDLNSALSGKVATSRQVLSGTGLTGGGSLTSDVTLSLNISGLTASTAVGTDYIPYLSGVTHARTLVSSLPFVSSVAVSQPAAGLTISGGPITTSGTLTFALANDLAAVEGLSTTGIVRRTGTSTWDTITDNSTNWNTAYNWGDHSTLYVKLDQSTPQTIGTTGARLSKLWATDITVTNTITGSVSGTSTALAAQYIDWSASSGGNSIANKPTLGTAAAKNIPATGDASVTEVVYGTDTRLTNARTPASHTHGNISNAGAIGSTTNKPIITTTSGVLTTGDWGSTANTFAQGNDARFGVTTNSLAIAFDSGGIEGTDLYTFNGSAAKSLNIKGGGIVSITKAAGEVTISATSTLVYPAAGIALSTGTGWSATSIPNNSSNWDTAYTNRLTSASATSPLTLTLSSNVLIGSMTQSGTASSGWLSFTDWNTFNNKVSSPWSISGSGIRYNSTVGINAAAPTTAQVGITSSLDNTLYVIGTNSSGTIYGYNLADGAIAVVGYSTGTSSKGGFFYGTSTGAVFSGGTEDIYLSNSGKIRMDVSGQATDVYVYTGANGKLYYNYGATTIDLTGGNVITTQGDLIVGNSSGEASRLAISGTSGRYLYSNGTTASWQTLSVSGSNFSAQTQNQFFASPNGVSGTPTFRNIVASDIPTLNQSTTGSAGSVINVLTFSASGSGAAPGTTYNGSVARTLSYDSIGAQPAFSNLQTGLVKNTLGTISYVTDGFSFRVGSTPITTITGGSYLNFSATGGVTLSGSGSGSNGTLGIGLETGIVSANTYASPSSVTVDTYGRVTAITAGSGGTGTATSVAAGNGMNFTTFTTSGSVTMGTPSNVTSSSTNSASGTTHSHALDNSGVSAGSYTYSSITVDAKGRITSASNGTTPVTAPAGSNTQVQYNNSGSFGASSNFTFNSGTIDLRVGATNNTGTVTSGNFILSSDIKLKENISNLNDVTWTDNIKFKKFNYISDETHRERYGVIANELEEVNSNLVYNYEDNEGINYKGVSYIDLLIAKIARLEQRLEKLENE